jgi:hypothetical protein
MKIVIWTLTGLVLALWSAPAWLAYTLIHMSGGWLSGNADMLAPDPQAVEFLSWLGRLGAGVGETIVIVVWAIGALIMVTVGWLFTKLVDRDRRLKAMAWHPDDPRATAQAR